MSTRIQNRHLHILRIDDGIKKDHSKIKYYPKIPMCFHSGFTSVCEFFMNLFLKDFLCTELNNCLRPHDYSVV